MELLLGASIVAAFVVGVAALFAPFGNNYFG